MRRLSLVIAWVSFAVFCAPAHAQGPGDRHETGRTYNVRSAVVAPNAAVATAHPLATQTALDVMKAGGSAVDAAIAANAMLGLVEPTGNGIGGDLFAIVWDPKTKTLYGYNGSGRSPKSLSFDSQVAASQRKMQGKGIAPSGVHAVSVPGTVDGWFALHDRFGNRKMRNNLAPAIAYARAGAPIPQVIAYYWRNNERAFRRDFKSGMLEEFANAEATYFSPSPREGSLFKNPDLAETYAQIAKRGRKAFYTGKIAETIDAYMKRIGGFLSAEDLAAHAGEWVEPLCVPYRDTLVCELPPNTQGIAALQMLQMLERFPMKEWGFGHPDALMAQVEAKRLAFEDRARGYVDPAYALLAPQKLIDADYARRRSAEIDVSKAMEDPAGGSLAAAQIKLRDGDTTYLTVADETGMMVSLIQSNYRGMGSGLVPDGLGFMLQDRGELFSLDPAHPNVYVPGKRPFHTIIPAFAFRKNPAEPNGPYQPWLSFGLMGGGMQPQGHVQVILNLVDFGMGLQEAGDAARWEHLGGCEPTEALTSDCAQDKGVIEVESGIPAAALKALEARGHRVKCCQSNHGGYQAIMRDFETGAWIAATEMRKDGAADGF